MDFNGATDQLSSAKEIRTVKENSQISIRDLDSDEVFTFCIVPSDELDAQNSKISVLAPLGIALIGKGVGSIVIWWAPSGPRIFEVLSVFDLD